MGKFFLGMLKRFGRTALATLLAALVSYKTGDPKWLIIGPIINAIAKYLRAKFNIPNLPI